MWELMEKQYNDHPIEKSSSFYVGDAAGREGDFSCSDRKFAINAGIKFHTPEEFFASESPKPFTWQSINPNDLLHDVSPVQYDGTLPLVRTDTTEMVIFCGFPASGKSTMAHKYFIPNGYVHINRDTLKSQSRCKQLARDSLRNTKSVVIDNTNPSASVRAEYIDIAKELNVPVRCFRFKVPENVAAHLNMYREKKEGVPHVPNIGYLMFKKNWVEPTMAEGYEEIKNIYFCPSFESLNEKELFLQFT